MTASYQVTVTEGSRVVIEPAPELVVRTRGMQGPAGPGGGADLTEVQTMIDTAVSAAITLLTGGDVPAALDTLRELALALADQDDAVAALVSQLADKIDASDLAAVATSGSYVDLDDKPTIPADLAEVVGDLADLQTTEKGSVVGALNEVKNQVPEITGSTIRYIGDTEPDTSDWNVDDLWFDTSTE